MFGRETRMLLRHYLEQGTSKSTLAASWVSAETRFTGVPDALVSETGERLARVPDHRAFWFGWIAQHPETALFK